MPSVNNDDKIEKLKKKKNNQPNEPNKENRERKKQPQTNWNKTTNKKQLNIWQVTRVEMRNVQRPG